MALSAVLPMILGFLLANHYVNWSWIHYPFHSMVESVGAISALTISTLMMLMVNSNHLPRYYIWVACALIGMGILDGFHAVLHAGASFVWLHSMATMVGGLTFAAIWLPEAWLTKKFQRQLIISVVVSTLLISVLSITIPDALPRMVVGGEFSVLAKILNLAGGVGFLLGTLYFVHLNLQASKSRSELTQSSNNLVFANHCLLFGIAGLLFESSVIWDAGWWWWHILRLAAYLVVLVYFFIIFRQQQHTLSANEIKLSNINKQLEQRVYQRTEELEKASKAKSEFLSRMSHELRTPMNAILGFSQLLEMDENLRQEQKESLGEITNAGLHLMDLINEVLDLTKIEEDKLEVKIEDVNISNIMSSSLALMVPQAKERNIKLVNNMPAEYDYVAQVDRLRFKQVFINLLSNAIKYNQENGKVIVDVDLVNQKLVRVSIKDTGLGIAEHNLSKLFIPFERLHHDDNMIEGVGIGLVLSKRMMLLMGGHIGVKSTLNKGSTFYIEFPFVHKKHINSVAQ